MRLKTRQPAGFFDIILAMGNRDKIFRPILGLAFAITGILFFTFSCELCAQQNNLHILVPPSVDLSRAKAWDISSAYLSQHGARLNAEALDISMVFGGKASSGTYRGGTLGTALVGTLGDGRVYLGGVKKDMAGITFHASADQYWFAGGGDYPVWTLLASLPFSAGSFTLGNNKEEVTIYDLIAGVQGGAGLNLKAGDFVATPSVLLSLLSGYREKYKGGTYWDNLNSGVVKPFAMLSLGADLLYLPKQARLSATYQRTFSSGAERAVDSLGFRLTLGWDTWHRKKR